MYSTQNQLPTLCRSLLVSISYSGSSSSAHFFFIMRRLECLTGCKSLFLGLFGPGLVARS